jgi:hypothetical protein
MDVSFSGYEDVSLIDMSADRYIWLYFPSYKPSNETIAKEILHYGDLLEMAFSRLNVSRQFIIFTMVSLFKINYQIMDAYIEEAVVKYNQKIHSLAKNNINVKMIYR